MSGRLFIGNLPYDATETELREHCAQVGPVHRVFIPLDRETGKVRGFAFVEFEDPEHAAAAISKLHEKPFKDRNLVVNEARPSEARPPSGGSRPNTPSRTTGRPVSPQNRERTTVGEAGEPVRRTFASKPKRRSSWRGSSWEDGPRKEPIPEKRRGQIFGGYDDADEGEEDVDFENFATGLSESEDAD